MKNITIPYTKEIFVFFIAIFFYNLSNFGVIFWEGIPDKFAGVVVRVSVFCYYLVGAFFTLFFLQVMKADVAGPLGMYRVRRLLTVFQILQVPLLVLLCATPFSGALYYFDAENYYCRSFGYLIWFYGVTLNSISVILTGLIVFLLHENHKVAYAIESSRQMDRIQMKRKISGDDHRYRKGDARGGDDETDQQKSA